MDYVQTGLWQDQSHPGIMGWTWTLTHNRANMLISALTFIVAMAGSCAWTLVALFCHSIIVGSGKNVDAVDLQHQVVLQNSASPLDAALDFIKIHLAWSRARTRRRFLFRTLVIVFVAVFVWTFFAAASVLTSFVVDNGPAALVRVAPYNCGLIEIQTAQTSHEANSAYQEKAINDTTKARNYAQDFYMGTSKLRTGNSIYPQTNLSIVVDSGPCPAVNASRCSIKAQPIRMTSGVINSHFDLGINAPSSDRISAQFRTTCAAVGIADLAEEQVTANGTWVIVNAGYVPLANFTFAYNTYATFIGVGYQIQRATAIAGLNDGMLAWQPVPDFNRTDADSTMFFLTQNSIRYTDQVYDPIFNASMPETVNGNVYYRHSVYVDVMLCSDQYNLCNLDSGDCSGFAGVADVKQAWKHLNFNDAQQATANRVTMAMGSLGTWRSVSGLAEKALYASNHIDANFLSTGLPSNQWQIEALGWFQTVLAQFQAAIVEYAYKDELSSLIPVDSPYSITPNGTFLTEGMISSYKEQCGSQLIRSPDNTQNFSFFGVLLLLIISAALVITSMLLPWMLRVFGRRRGWVSATERARQADDKLHLLRQTLEGTYGQQYSWKRGGWDVPVVVDAEPEFTRPTVQHDLSSYHKLVRSMPPSQGVSAKSMDYDQYSMYSSPSEQHYTPGSHMSYQSQTGQTYFEYQKQHQQYQQQQQQQQQQPQQQQAQTPYTQAQEQQQRSQWWPYNSGQAYHTVPNPKPEFQVNTYPM